MKRLILASLMALVSAGAWAQSTAIVNVNVIPMTSETVVPAQTVIVDDGVIVAIGAVTEVAVPDDATIIDGTDRFLMPGLTEMHGHVTGTGKKQVRRLFNLFLANGVTTVRGMLGRPAHLELRDAINSGDVLGPRLITSGPSFNGNSVSSVAQARRMVREQHAAGYDFLKIHPGLSAQEFNAIADTANELGIRFAGHVPVSVGLAGALDKGMATIDHLDGYMAALLPPNSDTSGGYGGFFDVNLADQVQAGRIGELVAATRAAGVANVPTQVLIEQWVNRVPPEELATRADMRYVDRSTLNQWMRSKRETVAERGFDAAVAERAIEIRRRIIRELHEAGAVLLLGSDAPQVFNVPGFSLHHELALMVASGLTPYEALATGTTATAAFFGLNAGTVEEGRIADLVLVDDNPLEDIANSARVHGVVVRGRWLSRAELLRGLAH
ncbi:MAG: amidohydrolase family protein [Woeseiaceae bacterium]|nr:amidohydrolase family protein [Woeseiaceae bacterium]